MKKQILFIALFLLSFYANSQITWVSQATGFSAVSSGVQQVSVVDTNIVWICPYDGNSAHTTPDARRDFSRTVNGGANWVVDTVPAPTTYSWSMIYGLNADTAWAVLYDATAGAGGGIWKTMDGGSSWVQQDSGLIFNATSFPDIVYFWNDSEGVALGDPNPNDFEIYTTSDGGDNWNLVAPANIPPAQNAEFVVVGHYIVMGGTIWIDTNKGRVYKSTDKGHTWTVSSTGITVPSNASMDLAFWNDSTGLVRLYNATTGVNTAVKVTTDSGATWTPITPVGTFYGSDVEYVPGTTSRLISTGAATGFIGSSYSDDGGLNWTTIEALNQRTALGAADSTHIWAGGFTLTPTADGIFKYTYTPPVSCADANINPGTVSAPDTTICPTDTLFVTATGVFAPTVGDFSGISWIVSSADVSGTQDPLNEISIYLSYNVTSPAPAVHQRQFKNDGINIGPAAHPYGIWYWTPIVFGNATSASLPVGSLFDLNMDPLCTYGGNSFAVEIIAPGDPRCPSVVGVPSLNSEELGVYAYFRDAATIDVVINTTLQGKTVVEILDVAGRVVSSTNCEITRGANHQPIDVQNLPGGTYLIKVESNGHRAINKIVKL